MVLRDLKLPADEVDSGRDRRLGACNERRSMMDRGGAGVEEVSEGKGEQLVSLE
jgi:hypothetical protein